MHDSQHEKRRVASRSTSKPPGNSIAIFGAGIAGLTAAHELAERGFLVTVY